MTDIRSDRAKGAAARVTVVGKAALGVGHALGRLDVLALFPLLILAASWFGFDDLAMSTAFILCGLLAFSVLWGRHRPPAADLASAHTPSGRDGLIDMLDGIAGIDGRDSACILIQIDDWPATADLWGHDTGQFILSRVEERLQTALRDGDRLARLGDAKFGIVLGAMASARLALRETITQRLAAAISDPIAVRGAALRLTASIGHSALIRRNMDTAAATFKAAEAALSDATLHAPGAIRAYAPDMGRARSRQTALSMEVEDAIHSGAIKPMFQPQICARTRVLTGVETEVGWEHPDHGSLAQKDILAAAEASGRIPLLGQSVIHQALKALRDWDGAKAHIPTLSIGLAAQDLRDPTLPMHLNEEITRYGLTPHRITISVPEAVALQAGDDTLLAALGTLRDAGHPIDLDGFGNGAVSFPTLQRFGISRIKIDQSFIHGIDADAAKQRNVAAIVAMVNVLGMRCVAKGVETPEEMDMLATLGCDILQGFRVARPMNADRVADWARARDAQGKTIRLDDRRLG